MPNNRSEMPTKAKIAEYWQERVNDLGKADEEMLKLAAKAAGLQWWASTASEGLLVGTTCDDCEIWNPLTDDGDALRLAVKLWMSIEIDKSTANIVVCYWFPSEEGKCLACVDEPASDDPAAATRRAIVRAAAEAVEAMQ